MKTNFFIIAALVTSFISCSKADIHEPSANDGLTDNEDTCILTIGFSGDISAEYSPLTKGTSDIYYGLSITKDGSSYKNGVFSDLSKLTLAVPKGHTYKIKACAVTGTSSSPSVLKPFKKDASNKFLDGSMSSITSGDNSGYYQYFGTFELVPSSDMDVSIDMKLKSFSLQYMVTNVSDGSIKLSINSTYKTLVSNSTITTDFTSEKSLYTFLDMNNTEEPLTVSVIWTRGNGIVEDLGSSVVMVTPNKNNVIRINLQTSTASPNFSLVTEQAEYLGDEAVDVVIQ